MIRSSYVLLAAILLYPTPAFSQCGTQVLPGYTTPSTLGFDEIILAAKNFPPALAGAVAAAGDLWNNSDCNVSNGNSFPYFVQSGGDYVVQVNWVTGRRTINVTYAERNPPLPDPFCEAYGCPQSPILIDMDRNGFHLSGLSNPVAFDINADGTLDVMAWTQAGEADAFLALDLNDNGKIDDGGRALRKPHTSRG